MPSPVSDNPLFFYTDSTYFSGAEKSFCILAETAHSHGENCMLLCTPQIAPQFAAAIPSVPQDPSITRSKLSLRWFLTLRKLFREKKPYVVVVNMWSPYANTLLLLAAKMSGVPTLSIYHYYQERSAVRGILAPLRIYAYRLGERLSSRVLSVSAAHQKVLVEQFHFPAAKVGVLHNGIPPTNIAPNFEDHTPRKFLTVGSLEPAKGYDFLMTVLLTLTAPFTLTVVGDGPERERLEELAKPLGNAVIFTGKQSDMESLYATHDVLLQPSEFENLSMAILEAMTQGLTVIANDVGGNSELISNGTDGWLLPLHDTAAWEHALTQAATEPLSTYRIAAHARWQKLFTAEAQYEAFKHEVATLHHAA